MRTINLLAVLCLAIACAARADEKPPKMPEPKPPGKTPPPAEDTFAIKFVRVPWSDVFARYAELSGLKADVKVKVEGAVTIITSPNRKCTIAEFTDLLNEALAQQKCLLIPHHKSFAVVSTEKKIDPKLIPAVEIKDLPKQPRTALVEVAIPLVGLDADDVAPELKKLLTPLGEIVYAKGKWVIVRDTVGNIRHFFEVLETCKAKAAPKPQPVEKTYTFSMKDAAWDDVLAWYEKTTGLTHVTISHPQGKFSFTPEKPDQQFTIAQITDILNDALAKQKLILIRRHMTFFIVDLSEPLSPRDRTALFKRISLEDVAKYGRTELVEVRIAIPGMAATDVADELKKLLTPLGEITPLDVGGLVIIRDAAGNIRRIIKVLETCHDAQP